MEWIKRAIELPPGWHSAVSALARELGGDKRGMTKYVWAIAAQAVLDMDPERLKARAKAIRELCEDDPDALATRDDLARRIAEIEKVRDRLRGQPPPKNARRKGKGPGRLR